jgi:energy-coupling factor transporter ATP-binding protein EcfA2
MTSRPDASAIALDRIEKRYGATVALSDATFAVAAGAVHALLGENGAGKSTLVKILSGIIRPDSGTMRFFGQVAEPVSRGDSSRLGLETAFQEIPLVPDLTVAQNILLPDEPRLLGFLRDRWAAQRRVERILSDLDLPDIDPLDDIRDLDLSVRQRSRSRAPSRGDQKSYFSTSLPRRSRRGMSSGLASASRRSARPAQQLFSSPTGCRRCANIAIHFRCYVTVRMWGRLRSMRFRMPRFSR